MMKNLEESCHGLLECTTHQSEQVVPKLKCEQVQSLYKKFLEWL
jgi:hypothetical protein